MKDFSNQMRSFWDVDTLEEAKHQRVTVPPMPEIWNDAQQSEQLASFLDRPLTAGQTVLDYGCGVGRTSRSLALSGMSVIAVDVSPKMLEHLKLYCGDLDIQCILSDGYGCPSIESHSVDGCVSQYCFQHMPTVEIVVSVMRDIFRVLKDGGWFRVQSIDHRQDVEIKEANFLGVRQRLSWMLTTAESVGFEVSAANFSTMENGVGSYLATFEKTKQTI